MCDNNSEVVPHFRHLEETEGVQCHRCTGGLPNMHWAGGLDNTLMRWAAYNSAYTQLDKQFRRSASFDIQVFGGGGDSDKTWREHTHSTHKVPVWFPTSLQGWPRLTPCRCGAQRQNINGKNLRSHTEIQNVKHNNYCSARWWQEDMLGCNL